MENPVWYMCKYCRRCYSQKHLLIEHKKLNHYELLMKDVAERKLAKAKEEEAKRDNETSSSSLAKGNSNAASAVPAEDSAQVAKIESGFGTKHKNYSTPEKSVDASGSQEKFEEKQLDVGLPNSDGYSDSEIDIVFDSHPPLASPMKPLSPNSPQGNSILGKRKRYIEDESSQRTSVRPKEDIQPAKFKTLSSLIQKLEESGNHLYCKKCCKPFLRRSSLRTHYKICHMVQSMSMKEYHTRFHMEVRQVEIEAGNTKCLSVENVLLRISTTSVSQLIRNRSLHTARKLASKGRVNVKECLKNCKLHKYHTKGKSFTCIICRDLQITSRHWCKKNFMDHIYRRHVLESREVRKRNFILVGQRAEWRKFAGGDAVICKLCGNMYPDVAALKYHLQHHSFSKASSSSK